MKVGLSAVGMLAAVGSGAVLLFIVPDLATARNDGSVVLSVALMVFAAGTLGASLGVLFSALQGEEQ